jgi:hypothetical protein
VAGVTVMAGLLVNSSDELKRSASRKAGETWKKLACSLTSLYFSRQTWRSSVI